MPGIRLESVTCSSSVPSLTRMSPSLVLLSSVIHWYSVKLMFGKQNNNVQFMMMALIIMDHRLIFYSKSEAGVLSLGFGFKPSEDTIFDEIVCVVQI